MVVLILARVGLRTFRSYRGTRFSLSRTYVYTAVYVIIGAVFSSLSYTEGVPVYMAVPEVLIAFAAGVGSYRYTDRRIAFWKGGDGTLYFRGGVIIYLVYLAALVVRLSIDIAVIGPAALSFSQAVSLSGSALYATMATDLLLVLGIGLLIGRGARVAKRYGRIQSGAEKVPEVPPAGRGKGPNS